MPQLHKFLIVDSVPENRFLVAKALLKKFPGSVVQECEESAPAIVVAQDPKLAAIVVHRGLDVDAQTLVAFLRRVTASVPIIMVSGRDAAGGTPAGADAFLNYESWQQIGVVVEKVMATKKLPAAPAAGEAAAAAPAAAPRILYLEDDADDVDLLRETLAVEGIAAELEPVRTPQEFTAAMRRPAPKLILADGKVAGFPTSVALQFARAWYPDVPFFCLSGTLTDEKIAAMREAGAAGCLSKQDLSATSATIRRALAGE